MTHDLELIRKWAHQWKMEFNPDPTKQATEVHFSWKTSKPNRVSEQKHLGLIFDSHLSFESHIKEKINKAKKNIGIIKYLSNYLPLKTSDQIYKT